MSSMLMVKSCTWTFNVYLSSFCLNFSLSGVFLKMLRCLACMLWASFSVNVLDEIQKCFEANHVLLFTPF